MALASKGISVRQTSTMLLFDAFLQAINGALLTTGTTTVKLYEVQSDGTLKSYDFNDNTFKTGTLTTETLAMTVRTGNNTVTNTGYWSATLSTLTGFTAGGIYLALVNNTGASPTDQLRKFQFGSAEGDLIVTSAGYLDANVTAFSTDTTSVTRLKNLFTACVQATVDTGTLASTTTAFETSIVVNKDLYTTQALYFVTGQNAGFTTGITGYTYTGNSKVELTVNTLPYAPANTDIFLVFGKVS